MDVIKQSCLGCHGKSSQIAPPFEKIYKVYKEKSASESEMEELFIKFLNNPTKENVLLSGAYKKYGSMPKINLSESETKDVSKYLAKGDYSKLYEKTAFKMPTDPMKIGSTIKKGIKSELGKNLLGAIKEKGTLGAIGFCHTKAIPITKTKMKELNASIKRATDKPRNPNNLATDEEMTYVKSFKKALSLGKKLKPFLVEKDDKYHYYAPIVTNQMCMQCHGNTKSAITKEVQDKIDSLYPHDKAKGYSPNEIRGIFSISWDK